MSSLSIGFSGLAVVIILLAIRVPIAVALGGVSLVGIWLIRGPSAAFGALGSIPFDFAAHWSLSAVPMFLLLGSMAYRSGVTATLYDAARLWLNWLPGGLAVATNWASAGFAAMSGSSIATAAAIGRLAIPEMLRLNYDKALATGTVAAAGTLGALIPPSVLFIIYGWYTEQSVAKLFIAGLLPGILTAFGYSFMIISRCILKPELAPKTFHHIDRMEKWRALGRAWPLPVLMVVVIGGIYGGITTPTEAGAFGAFAAMIVAACQGRLSLQVIRESVVDTVATTASVFFIAIGAILLTRFLAIAGVPRFMAAAVTGFSVDAEYLVIAMAVVYGILGMFLDPIGLMLLTLPVFLPIFQALNLDLIWLGVLVVKFLEIGVLTPPVGLNCFVVKQVAGDAVPVTTVFRGVGWFLAVEVVVIALLFLYPQISLYLPSLM